MIHRNRDLSKLTQLVRGSELQPRSLGPGPVILLIFQPACCIATVAVPLRVQSNFLCYYIFQISPILC